MHYTKLIQVIDSHTQGQATRIIIAGTPLLKGQTMLEKKEDLATNYDFIRTVTMHEPRGHADMFGAILVPPTLPEADMGVIFLDGAGYLNMCGHGTIGVATVLLETGLIPITEPITHLKLETPAGLIAVTAKVNDHRVIEVSFKNVPAFLYKESVAITLPKIGNVICDIAFGGSFFVLIDANQLGVTLQPDQLPKIVPLALNLLKEVNSQIEIKHPYLPVNQVELVEIYAPSTHCNADAQNVVILGKGEVDRSPCGTGTSAKVATLYSKGLLALNEKFVYESILGTQFTARAVEETVVGEFKAVIPEITGSAFITGYNQLVIDDNDPVKYGFVLH